MQTNKQGIFTSLKKQPRQSTPPKKQAINPKKWNFCCEEIFNEDGEEVKPTPTKIKIQDYQHNISASPKKSQENLARSQFSFSPPKLKASSSTYTPTSYSPNHTTDFNPTAVKTIILTPVPVINPVIISSAKNQEAENLKIRLEMLLEQYKYVYDLYEELRKQNKSNGNNYNFQESLKRQKKIPASITQLKIKKTEITRLLNDFQNEVNQAIDRVVDSRIQQGQKQIEKISASTYSMWQQQRQVLDNRKYI